MALHADGAWGDRCIFERLGWDGVCIPVGGNHTVRHRAHQRCACVAVQRRSRVWTSRVTYCAPVYAHPSCPYKKCSNTPQTRTCNILFGARDIAVGVQWASLCCYSTEDPPRAFSGPTSTESLVSNRCTLGLALHIYTCRYDDHALITWGIQFVTRVAGPLVGACVLLLAFACDCFAAVC
jgi:hypothetical protein